MYKRDYCKCRIQRVAQALSAIGIPTNAIVWADMASGQESNLYCALKKKSRVLVRQPTFAGAHVVLFPRHERRNEDPRLCVCWASPFRVRLCRSGLGLSSSVSDWLGKSGQFLSQIDSHFCLVSPVSNKGAVLTPISLLVECELGEEGGGKGWWSLKALNTE